MSGVEAQESASEQQAADKTDQEFLQHTAVIIPAQNEAESIELVLHDLPEVGCVIVVDNGSNDGTGELAEAAGALVVREEIAGYGQACLTGIAHLEQVAASLKNGPDYVAFLDADYSDYPERLSDLVRPIHEGEYDFVLGSRLLGEREKGAMPPQSVYGNKLAVALIRMFWGYSFTDLGPFRAIHRDSLTELKMNDRNFGWTVEMQIKAVVNKLRIKEVPVPYRCRVGTSKISGTISGTIRAGYKILYTIARYRWLTRNGVN